MEKEKEHSLVQGYLDLRNPSTWAYVTYQEHCLIDILRERQKSGEK